MLKDIFEERGLSVYKVSKDTNISYSTLNDIVIEKTDIKKASAELVYRLSKYLNLTMETLFTINDEHSETIYIHNIGRSIVVETRNCRHQYLGPKNLISFRQINKIEGHVVYIEAIFKDSEYGFMAEEEYIDLQDVLEEDATILNLKYSVQIGKASKIRREDLIDEALMVSDNLSIKLHFIPNSMEPMVEVRSMSRMESRAVIRLLDYAIVETNMSVSMQQRAIDAVKRNIDLINDESVVMYNYA